MNDGLLTQSSVSGRIEGLYIKSEHGQPTRELQPESQMICEAGFGILGDVHANRLSPRQVLLTIACELEDLQIAWGVLGENIVISSGHPDLFRPGSAIVTESGVEIRLTMFCEPCKRIAHVESDLSKLINRRGILGVFETGGRIQKGDSFAFIPGRYDPLPESAYQKFLDFASTIPEGTVVRYRDIAVGMGAADSFVRAIPGYIKRSLGRPMPFHRIVNARGGLLDFIPGQANKLAAEGILVASDDSVSLSHYLWQG